MSLPAKKINIQIGENTYEIKFPNNGQLIDIERMKQDLSGGHQNKMLYGSTQSANAYLLIEAIATFGVLIPKLQEDLLVKNLMELDPFQSKSIVKAYSNVFYPWYQEWFKIINEDDSKEEKKKDA